MHGGRLVHYSISLADGEDRPELIGQLDASATTLREHNPRIPAVVFLYGRPTAGLAAVCRAHGLMLHEQGPYEQRLAELCPAGWPANGGAWYRLGRQVAVRAQRDVPPSGLAHLAPAG